jgi:DNA (cytosine-5)-methyltransferase 1
VVLVQQSQTMTAYYNEIDPKAAAWLRELIKQGHIAPGVVDERSIEDITPAELAGYAQCHFFAGIGVWSYALRQAGWPDDRPVWTGSCPCQPFSQAGKGEGVADERHLWPAFYHLIEHGKPHAVPVFGEQVASKAGRAWLDVVQADLENLGLAVGALDLCAAGAGAPHIRQRLYWVADADGGHTSPEREQRGGEHGQQPEDGGTRDLADNAEPGRKSRRRLTESSDGRGAPRVEPGRLRDVGELGHHHHPGLEGRRVSGGECSGERTAWSPSDFIWCRDGKWRPVEPGTFPLAHGAPARVGRLRGYGNAIVAPLAAEFIKAYAGL